MEAHLHLRMPEVAKQRIKEAAEARGQTLSQFVKDAALDRAEEVLRRQHFEALTEILANAPEDDEPYTEEEQQADLEAWERYQKHGGTPHEEVMARARRRAA